MDRCTKNDLFWSYARNLNCLLFFVQNLSGNCGTVMDTLSYVKNVTWKIKISQMAVMKTKGILKKNFTNCWKYPMNHSITDIVTYRTGDCNVHWWGDRLPLRISFTDISSQWQTFISVWICSAAFYNLQLYSGFV